MGAPSRGWDGADAGYGGTELPKIELKRPCDASSVGKNFSSEGLGSQGKFYIFSK